MRGFWVVSSVQEKLVLSARIFKHDVDLWWEPNVLVFSYNPALVAFSIRAVRVATPFIAARLRLPIHFFGHPLSEAPRARDQ